MIYRIARFADRARLADAQDHRQPGGQPCLCLCLHIGVALAEILATLAVADDDEPRARIGQHRRRRSEEHTSELQSLMRRSYAVFRLQKKTTKPQARRTRCLSTRKRATISTPVPTANDSNRAQLT